MKKSVIGIVACFLAGVILLGYGVWGKLTEFKPDTEAIAQLADSYLGEPEKADSIARAYRDTYQYVVDGKSYFIVKEGTAYGSHTPLSEATVFFYRNDPSAALFGSDMPEETSFAIPFTAGGMLLAAALFWTLYVLFKKGRLEKLRLKLSAVRPHTKHILIGVLLAVIFMVGTGSAVYNGIRYVRFSEISSSKDLETVPAYIESATPAGENEYDLVLRYVTSSEICYLEVRVQEFRILAPQEPYGYIHFFSDAPHEAWLSDGKQSAELVQNAGTGCFLGGLVACVPVVILFAWLAATQRLARVKAAASGGVVFAGGLAIIWALTGNFDILPLFDKIGAFVLAPIVLIGYGLVRMISAVLIAPQETAEE